MTEAPLTFDRLWTALAESECRPPDDLAAAIRQLPDEGSLPPPWATWALVGLARHLRRQLWVAEVVRSRLGGDLESLAHRGAFGHPEGVPQEGLVPGLTDWEFFFHGCGCMLSNRITGEQVDVDFYGETAEGFHIYFYLRHLDSLKEPEPPEARLLELHPTGDVIQLAVDDLRDAGLLVPYSPECRALKLTAAVLDHLDDVDAFCERWGRTRGLERAWLGASIGDWPAALAALPGSADEGLRARVAAQAWACLERRRRALTSRLDREPRDRATFLALADLDPGDADGRLARALQGPLDGLTVAALERLPERGGPCWLPAIRGILGRLPADASPPFSAIRQNALRLLIRHGAPAREIRRELAKADGLALDEAALLTLEHAPDLSLPLIRRALRSPIPYVRMTIAATMALIDRPWSRNELVAVLRGSDDHTATAECRAALREGTDPEGRRAAEAWDEAHPREPEAGPFISMTEMMLRNCESSVRHLMETLHDRVLPLRGHVPEPPAGWWTKAMAEIRRRLPRRP